MESYIQMVGSKQTCSIFLSKHEGLGIAIVETQSVGCFTYCSDVVPEEADIGYGCTLFMSDSSKSRAVKIHQEVEQNVQSQFEVDVEKNNRSVRSGRL